RNTQPARDRGGASTVASSSFGAGSGGGGSAGCSDDSREISASAEWTRLIAPAATRPPKNPATAPRHTISEPIRPLPPRGALRLTRNPRHPILGPIARPAQPGGSSCSSNGSPRIWSIAPRQAFSVRRAPLLLTAVAIPLPTAIPSAIAVPG